MKRFLYLMAILLISSMIARADETITVSATNSDIAANLDLKVVAKIFGEAKDLEDFEARLNNPDSAFVNLDLNGDGDVDYIRVIETTNGNRHLIVLQAVLAKDIYQDVASIYVEKDEANNVSVQIIGDEYIYGENYVIEPVYVYRPVIYDWFWGAAWVCWNSPWYWGYWPHWWHPWSCWDYYVYWDHCRHFHHHHHGCSFHYAKNARPGARTMGDGVRRNDYATANPGHSFSERNRGMANARELPVATRTMSAAEVTRATTADGARRSTTTVDRVYGSSYTASTARPAGTTATRTTSSVSTVRGGSNGEVTRSTSVTTTRTSTTTSTSSRPSSASSSRPSSVTTTRSAGSVSTSTASRPSSSTTTSRPSSSTTTSRPSSSTTTSRPTSTGSSRPSSTSTSSRPSTSSSSRPSGSFSGGTHSSGSVSGGSGGSRGGGSSPRR